MSSHSPAPPVLTVTEDDAPAPPPSTSCATAILAWMEHGGGALTREGRLYGGLQPPAAGVMGRHSHHLTVGCRIRCLNTIVHIYSYLTLTCYCRHWCWGTQRWSEPISPYIFCWSFDTWILGATQYIATVSTAPP